MPNLTNMRYQRTCLVTPWGDNLLAKVYMVFEGSEQRTFLLLPSPATPMFTDVYSPLATHAKSLTKPSIDVTEVVGATPI